MDKEKFLERLENDVDYKFMLTSPYPMSVLSQEIKLSWEVLYELAGSLDIETRFNVFNIVQHLVSCSVELQHRPIAKHENLQAAIDQGLKTELAEKQAIVEKHNKKVLGI